MLFVFCGNDTVGIRREAFEHVASYAEQGFVVEYLDEDSYHEGALSDAAGATSLFGGERLYVIDTPSNVTEFYDEVVEYLPALSESTNTFVLLEGALLAPEKKKFAKYADNLKEIKSAASERFNTFALADALAKKDKKSLWLLIIEARRAGVSSEEIIGILWWQLKSMRLARVTSSASEAGMKEFPYNKAKRALSNFKDGEVEALSHLLLGLYHDGHLGMTDIDLALESWALRM